jgi:aryl-alcohol dehydrogenase-like predicted oxidoreductase
MESRNLGSGGLRVSAIGLGVIGMSEFYGTIPGTKRRKVLEDNAGAAAVRLSSADLARIGAALPPGAAAGERYSAPVMSLTNR